MAVMNEATLKSMAKMIQVMLPYEDNYEPRETSTKALREIVDVLRENNPKMNEFLPFLNHVFKQMDAREDTGKFDRALMRVWAIIHKYYPPIVRAHEYVRDADDPDLNPPTRLDDEEDEPKRDDSETPINFHGIHSTKT